MFKEIADSKHTVVFYESPHRIEKALASLASVLAPSRRVTVAREITKLHESLVQGTSEEVANHFSTHPGEVRGEFVVIVSA
jgi:16S rRNA (cytidine1402-2'-O)-methyltransferase